jgi:hypothetical protein
MTANPSTKSLLPRFPPLPSSSSLPPSLSTAALLAKIRPADANGVHVANSPPLQIANSITGAAAAEPGALPLLSYLRT